MYMHVRSVLSGGIVYMHVRSVLSGGIVYMHVHEYNCITQ